MSARPIRVLVVDDSALVRRLLSDALSRAPDIEVVGSARDPYEARERIVDLAPDVLTLDIEMPRMDGLTFLKKLMAAQPARVVIVSSVAAAHGENAVRALALGAAEVVSKPENASALPDLERTLVAAVRAAALVPIGQIAPSAHASAPLPRDRRVEGPAATHLVAVGASTGGPRALETLIAGLDAATPGMLIVQHIPAAFTRALAYRLDRLGAICVREAEAGDIVRDGTAYLAPGGRHMLVRRHQEGFVIQVRDGPAVHHQRPAVDVLFDSVAQAAGERAVGVLLTGMGVDGARGLLAMRGAGARTIAQDEASSAVFGMPREAIDLGAAQSVLPLESIAGALRAWDAVPAFNA